MPAVNGAHLSLLAVVGLAVAGASLARPAARRGSRSQFTPAFLRSLREIEDRCIQEQGHRQVCQEISWKVMERFPELRLYNEYGVYAGPGFEESRTHPSPVGYGHEWLRAPDGTIIDVATQQFEMDEAVTVPPFDPRQAWYLPEKSDRQDRDGNFLVGASTWTPPELARAIDEGIRAARRAANNAVDYEPVTTRYPDGGVGVSYLPVESTVNSSRASRARR